MNFHATYTSAYVFFFSSLLNFQYALRSQVRLSVHFECLYLSTQKLEEMYEH